MIHLDYTSPFREAFGPQFFLLKKVRKFILYLLHGVPFGLA
jgi:hypothetical protein